MPANINFGTTSFPQGERLFGPATVTGGGNWQTASISLEAASVTGRVEIYIETSYNNGSTWRLCGYMDFTSAPSGTVDFTLKYGRALSGATRARARVISASAWNSTGGSISFS